MEFLQYKNTLNDFLEVPQCDETENRILVKRIVKRILEDKSKGYAHENEGTRDII